jgi:hypothetical protein
LRPYTSGATSCSGCPPPLACLKTLAFGIFHLTMSAHSPSPSSAASAVGLRTIPLGVADRIRSSSRSSTTDETAGGRELLQRASRDFGRSGGGDTSWAPLVPLRTETTDEGAFSRGLRTLSEIFRASRRTVAPDFSNSVLDRRGSGFAFDAIQKLGYSSDRAVVGDLPA